jgi:hypothetical protein
MMEGKKTMQFESQVIQLSSGEWVWCARGDGLESFVRRTAPQLLPSLDEDNFIYCGTFRSERAARRSVRQFYRRFTMQARDGGRAETVH